MSTLNHLFDLPEQICYVQCGFCSTVLLVNVPCSSLSMVVTVRCGHCTSVLSVNMMKASFVPLHLLASLSHNDEAKDKVCKDVHLDQKALYRLSPSMMTSSDNEEEEIMSLLRREKRAPSAYNLFIKEEIRRLKTEHPTLAHREAFSTAAKNWAHFPPIQCKGDGESCDQEEEKRTWNSEEATEVRIEGNGFREEKAPRHSFRAKTPFK